jgi:ABC-type spermidine/putrescine transport system permease subunit II
MKKILIIAPILLAPLTLFAQQWNMQIDDQFAYASLFAGNFSLLLSIVIGLIATFLVFRSAKKLGGGLFGLVLNYIGIGVLMVVFGTIATVMSLWSGSLWANIISTVCFAIGYIFVVIGANKLLKGIMNT